VAPGWGISWFADQQLLKDMKLLITDTVGNWDSFYRQHEWNSCLKGSLPSSSTGVCSWKITNVELHIHQIHSLLWRSCSFTAAQLHWNKVSVKSRFHTAIISSADDKANEHFPFWSILGTGVAPFMGYGLDDKGSTRGKGRELFSSPPHPDRLLCPPGLLPNGF
jgi:hypothetical protein